MESRPAKRALWLTLAGLCLAALACFAFPMYVIQPFRAQGARELAMALAVRRWGPWLAIACSGIGLAVSVVLWKRDNRRGAHAAIATLAVMTGAFAGLSRVNVYERMFHPVDNPGFVAAQKAPVEADDMVMTVALSGEQRAYPIRTIGYHHIVNDRLGNVAIVATY